MLRCFVIATPLPARQYGHRKARTLSLYTYTRRVSGMPPSPSPLPNKRNYTHLPPQRLPHASWRNGCKFSDMQQLSTKQPVSHTHTHPFTYFFFECVRVTVRFSSHRTNCEKFLSQTKPKGKLTDNSKFIQRDPTILFASLIFISTLWSSYSLRVRTSTYIQKQKIVVR